MNRRESKGKPTFFWQPMFILLPVIGLACFGLYSMRQDRLLAEQEARDAGEALAQRLTGQFSLPHPVDSGALRPLFDYYNARFMLRAKHQADLDLTRWAGGIQDELDGLRSVKAWQVANPEFDLATLPPADGYLKPEPDVVVPRPPDWLAELTPEQRELWESAQESELVSKDHAAAQSALQKLLRLNPPKGAQANAQYLLLLAKTASGGLGADELGSLLSAGLAYSTELTDAGLPVGQLTCYQVLHQAPPRNGGLGLPDKFLRAIASGIHTAPSMVSAQLVTEAERVATATPSESRVASLRALWEEDQLGRQILEDFRDQHPPNTWASRAFWVDSSAGQVLLLLGDTLLASTNPPDEPALGRSVIIFPRGVVEKALGTALAKANITLPPYARVDFVMAGRGISLPQRATVQSTNGLISILGQAGAQWENIPGSTNAYPFQVRVLLASPEILYARQSQRTLMFISLILASTLVAMIGLFSAYSSFRRQQQLSEMKSDFVSSVSHELRAPIASVRLMAEGLERGKIPEPAKQHEYFKFIVQECRRLSSLIENVLDFSRIEEGRKRYEMESTDLVALTEQTVKVMETYAAERDISLTLRITGAAAPVDLDGKAMQQALVNLIDNAIKHSPKGSAITVSLDFNPSPAGAQPSSVLVSVEDHGEGIAASEQDKIFERFYRIGSELRRETQGVGIGLSIVKHIVEAHGGRVTVRSAPGQGSRFTIKLPMR